MNPRPTLSRIRALGAIFVLAGTILAARTPGRADEITQLAVRSPHERSGDFDALLVSWLDCVARHPKDFRVEVLLRRFAALGDFCRDEAALLAPAERLLDPAIGLHGVPRQIAIDIVLDLLRRKGREEDRARLASSRGMLLSWLVAGPFGKGKGAAMDQAFPPETEATIESRYRDGWQELRWALARHRGTSPRFEPLEHVYPSRGVVYAMAQLRAAAPVDALLFHDSSDLRIWVNGIQVYRPEEATRATPNRLVVPVRLSAGWNRILVKADGSYVMRIADLAGDPFPQEALEEERGLQVHDIESPLDPRIAPQGPIHPLDAWTAWLAGLDAAGLAGLDAAGLTTEDLASAYLTSAFIFQTYALDDRAVERVEKARALAPRDPWVLYHAGDILRGANYLPRTNAKNRSKQAFEAVLEIDPGFAPAYERVAGFLADDQEHSKAVTKLREGLERAPECLPLLLRLKSVFAARKWLSEEIEVTRRIAEVAPSSAVPPGFWSGYYRQRSNVERAIEVLRAGWAADRRQIGFLTGIFGAERFRNPQAAEAVLREALALEPDRADLESQLRELLIDTDRAPEAVALARARLEEVPQSAERGLVLADTLEQAGKLAEAEEARAAALALEPGNLTVKRFLARSKTPVPVPTASGTPTASTEDAFWAPWDEKLEDWIPKIPTEGTLVEKASAIVVLDISVLRFERDGSSSEYVHQAQKVLTEESKESLANVSTRGETLLLRTLTASLEVLEPNAAEGKNSFVMPGLAPGVFTEQAYRSENEREGGSPIRTGKFYFQDTSCEMPFLLSRYVIILPEGMDPPFIETNLDGDPLALGATSKVEFPKISKRIEPLEGGARAIIYEARNSARLEPAQFMPSRDEYFPSTEVRERVTWEDVAGQNRRGLENSALVTPEIEAAATELAKGIEGPLDQVKAAYRFVNGLVATEGHQPSAAAVLLEKSGNRNVLFKAILDALRLPNRWVFLRPQESTLPKTDWSFPGGEFFPYSYLQVNLPGSEPLYLSLSQRWAPFARLPEQLEGGKVFIPAREGVKIVDLPAPNLEDSATSFQSELTLGSELEVEAKVTLLSRQVSAISQKDQLKTLPAFQKDLVLRQLANRFFPGAKVASASFLDIDDPDRPFGVEVALTAPKALRKTGEDHLLKPVLQPANLVRSFCGRAEREHPFSFRGQLVLRDELRVSSGNAYSLHLVPGDTTLESPLGKYSIRFAREGETVTVKREVTLLPARISAADFPAFVEFCRKVDAAEQESIVFHAKA